MPGRNCPVRLTSTSGIARLSVEPRVHSGAMNCGTAMLQRTPDSDASSRNTASTTPAISSSTRVYFGNRRRNTT